MGDEQRDENVVKHTYISAITVATYLCYYEA